MVRLVFRVRSLFRFRFRCFALAGAILPANADSSLHKLRKMTTLSACRARLGARTRAGVGDRAGHTHLAVALAVTILILAGTALSTPGRAVARRILALRTRDASRHARCGRVLADGASGADAGA